MTTRIVADVLIPGRGDPIAGGTVLMDTGEITFAGPTSDAPASSGDETQHEVPVVMPGLWDCHAHFAGMPRPDIETFASADVESARGFHSIPADTRGKNR